MRFAWFLWPFRSNRPNRKARQQTSSRPLVVEQLEDRTLLSADGLEFGLAAPLPEGAGSASVELSADVEGLGIAFFESGSLANAGDPTDGSLEDGSLTSEPAGILVVSYASNGHMFVGTTLDFSGTLIATQDSDVQFSSLGAYSNSAETGFRVQVLTNDSSSSFSSGSFDLPDSSSSIVLNVNADGSFDYIGSSSSFFLDMDFTMGTTSTNNFFSVIQRPEELPTFGQSKLSESVGMQAAPGSSDVNGDGQMDSVFVNKEGKVQVRTGRASQDGTHDPTRFLSPDLSSGRILVVSLAASKALGASELGSDMELETFSADTADGSLILMMNFGNGLFLDDISSGHPMNKGGLELDLDSELDLFATTEGDENVFVFEMGALADSEIQESLRRENLDDWYSIFETTAGSEENPGSDLSAAEELARLFWSNFEGEGHEGILPDEEVVDPAAVDSVFETEAIQQTGGMLAEPVALRRQRLVGLWGSESQERWWESSYAYGQWDRDLTQTLATEQNRVDLALLVTSLGLAQGAKKKSKLEVKGAEIEKP